MGKGEVAHVSDQTVQRQSDISTIEMFDSQNPWNMLINSQQMQSDWYH